jgi:hypothetical protein
MSVRLKRWRMLWGGSHSSKNSKLRVTKSSTVDSGASRSLSTLVTVTECSLTVRPFSSTRTVHVHPLAVGVAATLMVRCTPQLWAWILGSRGVAR